jgi:hypothetical protein
MTTFSFAQLETLWIEAGGSKTLAPLAAGIGIVESGGDSAAHNPSGASGIWQIEIPLHSAQVPGGAGNVYSPEANAVAAVRISGNSVAGLTSNWLVDEPAGAAQAIVRKNKGVLPKGIPPGTEAKNKQGALSAQGGLTLQDSGLGGLEQLGGNALGIVTGTASTIGDVATSIQSIGRAVNVAVRFLAVLGHPSFWLRLGAFLAGVISAAIALYFLGKSVGFKAPAIMPIPV